MAAPARFIFYFYFGADECSARRTLALAAKSRPQISRENMKGWILIP
jgi:hypothetical protein